jgi:hypothetical protein
MSETSFVKGHRIRFFSLLFLITLFFVSGSFIPAFARADPRKEITSRILNLFPSYSGKVRELQDDTIVIQGAPNTAAQIGAYLLVKKRTLVRVVSVDGQEVRAVYAGKNVIQRGDLVSGWSRPLSVALVPMSREALQVLLEYSLPKGDLAPVRTEDVLTAMIQNNYNDFYALENMDAAVLGASLKTSLVLQVGLLSGFGETILKIEPHWVVEEEEVLDTFSVLLSSRQPSSGALRPQRPTTTAPPPSQQIMPELPSIEPKPETPPIPLSVLMASAGVVSQTSMPQLPSLSGFDKPTRWARILETKERIISMAPGRFTASGKPELAIGVPGKIQLYSLRKGGLRAGERMENADLTNLFWLDAWDVNGDGIDEVIVNTDEGVLLLAQNEKRLYRVHRREGLVIRRLGDQLFAQNISDLEEGKGPIYSVYWNGEDWEQGENLKHSDSMNLFAVVNIDPEAALFVGPDHKLSSGGQAVSKETFGQSNTPDLLDIDLPLFTRSISLPRGSLMLKNIPAGMGFLKKNQYSNGGKVVLLSESYAPNYSPQFRGYIADVALYDLDGDGTGEIFLSQVDAGVFGGSAYILRYK